MSSYFGSRDLTSIGIVDVYIVLSISTPPLNVDVNIDNFDTNSLVSVPYADSLRFAEDEVVCSFRVGMLNGLYMSSSCGRLVFPKSKDVPVAAG